MRQHSGPVLGETDVHLQKPTRYIYQYGDDDVSDDDEDALKLKHSLLRNSCIHICKNQDQTSLSFTPGIEKEFDNDNDDMIMIMIMMI